MNSVLAIDPGETTGWVFRHHDGAVCGGVIESSHLKIWSLLNKCTPDVVVLERFNLYPGKAAAQSYSSFYTVEVIGVVKLYCMLQNSAGDPVALVLQAPGDKKFSGALDDRFKVLRAFTGDKSEHMKDAYQHLLFYERKEKSL